jgi:hypothetical protein
VEVSRFREWIALLALGHAPDKAADLVRAGEAQRVIREAQDPRKGN